MTMNTCENEKGLVTGSVAVGFTVDGFAGVAEKRLATEVRKQSGLSSVPSVMDLVFDESTGEFRQVQKGEAVRNGTVVTGMTEEGFAHGV